MWEGSDQLLWWWSSEGWEDINPWQEVMWYDESPPRNNRHWWWSSPARSSHHTKHSISRHWNILLTFGWVRLQRLLLDLTPLSSRQSGVSSDWANNLVRPEWSPTPDWSHTSNSNCGVYWCQSLTVVTVGDHLTGVPLILPVISSVALPTLSHLTAGNTNIALSPHNKINSVSRLFCPSQTDCEIFVIGKSSKPTMDLLFPARCQVGDWSPLLAKQEKWLEINCLFTQRDRPCNFGQPSPDVLQPLTLNNLSNKLRRTGYYNHKAFMFSKDGCLDLEDLGDVPFK